MTWWAQPPNTSLNIQDLMLCKIPRVLQAAFLHTGINMATITSPQLLCRSC